ncbi:hypothetical protein [Corynebacterium diphtheriae]|uniref:hypothetical protein n=1 Tax=Corynebacterium diphtheriae TaxID=1717 RepID=UPI003140A0F5
MRSMLTSFTWSEVPSVFGAGEGRDAVSVECHRRWAFRNDVPRICAGTAAMSVS